MSEEQTVPPRQPARAPAINAPWIVPALIGAFAVIHAIRGFLPPDADSEVIFLFAFIPARFAMPAEFAGQQLPGGGGADVWTFFTYTFLHGDWMHLIVNSFWMLAFGTVVARRLGSVRFMALSLVSSAFAALAYLFLNWGELAFLVGASGAISGQMAAAARLIFAEGGTLATMNRRDLSRVEALSLPGLARSGPALIFLGIWLGANLVFGSSAVSSALADGRIAWEAHLGGFLAGLLLFGLFDSRPSRRHHDVA